MYMASSRKKAAGRKGGRVTAAKRANVSLAEEDRRYLNETLTAAKSKVGQLAAGIDGAAILEALEGFGLTSERVERLRGAFDDIDVRESVEKASEYLGEQIESAKEYARENPKKVIGGAAGVLVGASLLAMALRKAGNKERGRKAARKRAAGTSKAGKASARKRSAKSGGAKKSSKKR
jgi:hypothetical protein